MQGNTGSQTFKQRVRSSLFCASTPDSASGVMLPGVKYEGVQVMEFSHSP